MCILLNPKEHDKTRLGRLCFGAEADGSTLGGRGQVHAERTYIIPSVCRRKQSITFFLPPPQDLLGLPLLSPSMPSLSPSVLSPPPPLLPTLPPPMLPLPSLTTPPPSLLSLSPSVLSPLPLEEPPPLLLPAPPLSPFACVGLTQKMRGREDQGRASGLFQVVISWKSAKGDGDRTTTFPRRPRAIQYTMS